MKYNEGIFKDFEFCNGWGGNNMFQCSFRIGLNPYEIRKHLDEIREALACLCQNFRLLGCCITLDEWQHTFATAEELATEEPSIWSYTAIC